jgi:hypothetical protein
MSGTRKSNLKRSSSKRGTQRKHVTINDQGNQVVEFKKEFDDSDKPKLWISDEEYNKAIVESINEPDSVTRKKSTTASRLAKKAHATRVLGPVNKEVRNRKNLPELAATIARGRYNKPETPTEGDVIRLRRTQAAPSIRTREQPDRPIERKLTMFERLFGTRRRGGKRKNKDQGQKTRKVRKN